jgi:hypothetical protein
MSRDFNLYIQGKSAVASIRRQYHSGAYRVIRDPEGRVSLWAIEGNPSAPFSISFVEKGRVYTSIDDVPQDFLNSFLEYVRRSVQ